MRRNPFSLFSVERQNPQLVTAQFLAASYQIPILYIILPTNSWVLAVTHLDVAPLWLTLAFPLVLSIVCMLRLAFWWRARRKPIDAAGAAHTIVRTNVLAVLLSFSLSVWALAMFNYGDDMLRTHVAFFMAINSIVCMVGLTHIRSAAIAVAVIANGFSLAYFMHGGHIVFVAMGVNLLIVSVALLVMLLSSSGNLRDLVTSQQELEVSQERTLALSDENHRLANLDSLTELPNRRSFFATLHAEVARARATKSKLIVGIMDLDGFKPVNDTYGHPVGDTLLKRIAERLSDICKDDVSVYRLGGDEFAIILHTADTEEALDHAYDICASLRKPFVLQNCTARVSGTLGLAIFPDLAQTSQELFERADYAMYRAKHGNGRGEAWLFSRDDENQIKRRSLVEQSLRTADLEDELSVVFQPIVDAHSGETLGFEALARWHSPLLGHVSPSEFIPTAEQSGQVNNLSPVLLAKALAVAATWPAHLRLSFNLSVFDMFSTECLLRIIALIGNSPVNPRRIDLEITETAMVGDFAAILAGVEMLKRTGVSLSLDDFGTGYSSLRQVHQLPLDKLKIDRSFVSGIDRNEASQKIVRSLVSLCNDLNLSCVVEGVETMAERETVRRLGCHYIQGYYFGQPMTPRKVEDYLFAERSQRERLAANS
jgi:diguanylate cyclase (GGDEF)-like protein